MTKKWLQKYQYIYKLCNILLVSDTKYFVEEINNPPFQELYDYDFKEMDNNMLDDKIIVIIIFIF